MKTSICLLSLLVIFMVFSHQAMAESNYVLPYPSSMPGSKFYKIKLIYEKVEKYWYFGNFGQFEYNLKKSDKYLVETKTLFEYKQYLLAYQSLKKSNDYFVKAPQYLVNAKKENKKIDQKQNLLKNASLKHIEELKKIEKNVPSSFTWTPEKSASTNLNIRDAIEKSINIREKSIQPE